MIKLDAGETVFSRAAEEIDRRGWAQGWFEVGGKVCIAGAINCAVFGSPYGSRPSDLDVVLTGPYDVAVNLLESRGEMPGRPLYRSLSGWNDKPERTKEEVVALLMELHEQELASA